MKQRRDRLRLRRISIICRRLIFGGEAVMMMSESIEPALAGGSIKPGVERSGTPGKYQ